MQRMAGLGTVASVFFLVPACGSVAAATLQVPVEHATIQQALDTAEAGDTVLVAPGMYAGGLDFGGKSIVLRSSDGPETTTIDGGGLVRIAALAAYDGGEAVIEGFTLQHGTASFGAGIELLGGRAVVRGNIFRDNDQGSGGSGAAVDCFGCTAWVEHNVFTGHTCDSQFVSGVVSVLNDATITLRSNLFVDNDCRAINVTAPVGAIVRVLGNTVVGNPAGIYLDARVELSSREIRHNVIAGNAVGLDVVFGGGELDAEFADNVLHDNAEQVRGVDDPIGTDGNRAVDPGFADAAAGDYRLRIDSPLVDTPASGAIDAAAFGEHDLAGACRLADGDGDAVYRFDVGAFERADARFFRDGFDPPVENACAGALSP